MNATTHQRAEQQNFTDTSEAAAQIFESTLYVGSEAKNESQS
ncbi:hypothetical protein [Ralstonia edaphi]|nr:hypothetical protein [Ralstonia sp. LMG 6871]